MTYRGYIDNHIKPNIGKVPLEKLTPLELQKFYKKLLEQGRAGRLESRHQAKGLSPKTVRNILHDHLLCDELSQGAETDHRKSCGGLCPAPAGAQGDETLLVEQLQSFLRESKDSGVFELSTIWNWLLGSAGENFSA